MINDGYIKKSDAEATLRALRKGYRNAEEKCAVGACILEIQDISTADVVSREVLDQIRWERDVAMEQLKEHGIPFGGIAPDVVKVVRCKDCTWFSEGTCKNAFGLVSFDENAFCSYGERRNNDNL